MFAYVVDGPYDYCEGLANAVFHHCLVESVPYTFHARFGEQPFNREATERVRLMVRGESEPAQSVSMKVYEFAS